jgi:DNA mismatch endonuclease (patch repair protein)
MLRRALTALGLRYRVRYVRLPGRPDIVFPGARVVLFCDGDFWHGRELPGRLERLALGHNADYWIAKIKTNVERDQTQTRELELEGWLVLRFWESDIKRAPEEIAREVGRIVRSRLRRVHRRRS